MVFGGLDDRLAVRPYTRSLWLVIQKRYQNAIMTSAYDSDQIYKLLAAYNPILFSLINVFGGLDDRLAVRPYTRSLWLVIQKRDQNEIMTSAYDSDQINKLLAASILILYSLINVFGRFDDRFAVRPYTKRLWLVIQK
jgi:UDP-N-acetylmuramyl pentapeptide phosphotransferase/UDP-N-acetylglucosamine-1-phosphate transferase